MLWFNFFFWFLISSWCRLCWQLLTAGKKYQNKKKKALPKPKDLKYKTKPIWRGMERGSYCLGGPWNLLQSVKRSPKRAPLAGWSSVLCVSYFCVHSRVQVCLDFDLFFLMFSKKAVSAAMLRLFLSVSVCLCLCACSCSLERGVVFLM